MLRVYASYPISFITTSTPKTSTKLNVDVVEDKQKKTKDKVVYFERARETKARA